MPQTLTKIRQDFTEGLSKISRFWGFPKGMGAIFAVLYLSPTPLSLDEIVQETGITKGAISTEIRAEQYGQLLAKALPKVIETDEEFEHYVSMMEALDRRQDPLNSEEQTLRTLLEFLITDYDDRLDADLCRTLHRPQGQVKR